MISHSQTPLHKSQSNLSKILATIHKSVRAEVWTDG